MVTSSTSKCQLLIIVSLESLYRYLQPTSSQAPYLLIIHYTATCLISQNALTKDKPELKGGFCKTSFKLS